MKRMLITGIALFTVASGAARVFGETLEEVEKKITDQMSKHKSISYKMKSSTDLTTKDLKFKSDSEGQMEVARRGDKWVTRTEAITKTERKMGEEKEVKEDGKILMIYDGEFAWTYSESGEQKSAMKMKPDNKTNWNPFDGKAMFVELHKHFDFKLLPDETVDGKSVYVIELKAKKSDKNEEMAGIQRLVSYYRKDNGLSIKSLGYDKDGKVNQTSTISDLKLNEEIKPERFVFKAPPGVEVTDMTKIQEQSAEEPATKAEDTSPKAKEEKPKPTEEPQEESKPKKKGIGGILNKIK